MSNEFHGRISVGMKVRTLDGTDIGRVKGLHGETFEVEKGLFFNQDHALAFSEIKQIDGDGIELNVAEETFAAMRRSGGVGTSLHDRAEGVVDHARAAIDEAIHAGHSRTPKS